MLIDYIIDWLNFNNVYGYKYIIELNIIIWKTIVVKIYIEINNKNYKQYTGDVKILELKRSL